MLAEVYEHKFVKFYRDNDFTDDLPNGRTKLFAYTSYSPSFYSSSLLINVNSS